MDKLKRDALDFEDGKSGRTVSFEPLSYQAIDVIMALIQKLSRAK